MANKITTIKIEQETKKRIDKLKEYKRETYDDILKKILGILNVAKTEPEKAKSILEKVDETRIRNMEKESASKVKK